MDTTTLLYIGLAVIVVGVLVYQVVTSNSRRNKRFLSSIINSWGNLPKREYDYGELEHIAKYFQATKKEEFTIDDITWNDLDMDSVFCMMNQCRSSSGDDYLYKLLRTPLTSKKELEERNRIISFFQRNEKTRIAYQMELSKVGHSKKFALIDYVNNITKLLPDSNLDNYMHLFLYVVVIFAIIAQPASGILVAIGVLIYNIYTYYKKKTEIEPYYVSVGAIVHLVSCAQGLLKLNVPELKDYTENLKQAVNVLSSVKGNAKFLGSTDKFSGNMGSMMMDYLNMFFRIDLIMFNRLLAKVQKHKKEMLILMDEIGRLDAYISIASFRELMPFYCESELEESKEGFVEAKDMYHPLLSEPVANSIYEHHPVLLTGSNASGKSTFLKTVAINALLSQTCGMALAKEYRSCFFRIYSSMALKDNIQGSESYFIVEIKSLKRILDAVNQDKTPVLCFVDEVLRGTNTVERIAASSRILQSFADSGVMCFAATHDIELTTILKDCYSNYHFQEEVTEDEVKFDYKLYAGPATTRNAIKLLNVIGYDKNIIKGAEQRAMHFLTDGNWKS